MKTSFVIFPSILGLVLALKCLMCVNQQSVQFVQFVQRWIFTFIVQDSKLYAIGSKEKGQGNYVLP
jgi:hypothetical protein